MLHISIQKCNIPSPTHHSICENYSARQENQISDFLTSNRKSWYRNPLYNNKAPYKSGGVSAKKINETKEWE
jgi:hypothetical protein